jgi:nucleotide-binding universal stress UspA family protein
MFKKIVVAYDGTGPNNAAVHRGGELARLCKADLHLLGIVVTAGGMLLDPAIVSVDLLETERQYLNQGLAEAVRDLALRGVHAKTCIRDGEPSREIIAYIHEIQADLVVVGRDDKGRLARWFEGSVGTQLFDTLPCSLLVATDDI